MEECCRAGPVHPLIPDLLPFCGMIETYIGDRFAVPHRVHVVVTIVSGAKHTLRLLNALLTSAFAARSEKDAF